MNNVMYRMLLELLLLSFIFTVTEAVFCTPSHEKTALVPYD